MAGMQGWAILDDFIAIPILGVQNCRELVKSKAPENFIGKNWSNIEKPKKELVNLEKNGNSNKGAILPCSLHMSTKSS